jgi:aryl-alcohol dehydrogenase-like predicted oxidoreductase
MDKVRLGRTGLEVSVAGLGCGGHSRLGLAKGKDLAHAAGIVRQAVDLGITFIDTARAYGTEEAVGLGLEGRRHEVVISTKAHVARRDGLVSARDMAGLVDESLRRLRTDYIDVFLLHGLTLDHWAYAAATLLPELRRQQAAGKIGFVGASEQFGGDTGHAMLSRALKDDPFDVVMVGFNLLNPSARARVFPATRARHVGVLVMFAVREALSRPQELRRLVTDLVRRGDVDPAGIDLEEPLGFVTRANGGSVVEAAYRFCRHEPGAEVILTGTGDAEHLKANIEAILAPALPPEVQNRLQAMFGKVDSVSGN